MTAQIIDGTAIAAKTRAQVAEQVAQRAASGLSIPGLATVLVGDNPASQTYVRSKRKASAEVGIASFPHELPATATQGQVEELVRQLNADPR
ncbi:MAG: tetrahydrofolate dehydrogenase/cyclohydrolase catalytic domain-containing protein, partial [Anaerolineales bacterium]